MAVFRFVFCVCEFVVGDPTTLPGPHLQMNYLDANPIRIPPGVTPEEAKERFKPFPNHLDAAGADSCIVHAGMAAAFGSCY
jgi:hypothetical protein